jgi:cytochrome c oxidase subunit III
MKREVVTDLSYLPLHGTGSASVTWWGTLAFMLIEGTGFALILAVYLYLASLAPEWPLGAPLPDLGPGTAITVLLLVSAGPNFLVARWARAQALWKVRLGLIVMLAFGIILLILRIYEFMALNTRWDSSAYGSVTWVLLGLHTTHILTDLMDTLVLTALMLTRHGRNKRRFGDVEDNALYWYFVVLTWLPIYACLYGVPRL